MSAHVPEELLLAFVHGDVDESAAIHVAEHLDDCPRCATRAADLEPLAGAFAAVDDPRLPFDLIDQILVAVEEDARRQRFPTLQVAIGTVLLGAAVMLIVLGTDPLAITARTLDTVPVLANFALQGSATIAGLVGAASLFVFSSTLAVRQAQRRNA